MFKFCQITINSNRFLIGSPTDSSLMEFCNNKQIMNFIPTSFQAFPIPINVEIKQENVPSVVIFNCAFCNQTFSSKKELKDHKSREHKSSEPRQKKIKDSSNPTANYVHHQPKFQCEYCFKGFDQSHRLKQHQISHREPTYECDEVKFLFLTFSMENSTILILVWQEIQMPISS